MTSLFSLAAVGLLAILPPGQAKAAKPQLPAPGETAPVRSLVLSVGQTVPVQMSTRQPVRTVVNENDKVAVVRSTPDDPTTVLVTALAPGRTRITLTGAEGKKEVCTVGQPDRVIE